MAHELTFEEINSCKKALEKYRITDSIDEPVIAEKDLKRAIEDLHFKIEDSELDELKTKMKVGKEVDFPTFLRVVAVKFKQREFSKALGDAFKYFDKTNKGYLTYEELRNIITDHGPMITRKQADDLLAELGLDYSEKFRYEDFVENKI